MPGLSKKDANLLLDLIYQTVYCQTREEFKGILQKIPTLFPFDYTTCVFLRKESGKDNYDVLNINYPQEWLDLYISKNFNLIDPIIRNNFKRYELQYWAETYKKESPPKEFRALAEVFGLKNGYTSGARNCRGDQGSLFSFSGRYIENNFRTREILKHFVPHLHEGYSRVTASLPSVEIKKPLSNREKEVLRWASQGKTSWDISVILDISERTVNFHITSIMQKLNAVTRAHAIAVALGAGLIDID